MTKNTGGSAFPVPEVLVDGNHALAACYQGMTLRDWFAGMALQGMLAYSKNPMRERINESDEKCIVEQAHRYADAMLREREK